MRAGEGLEKSGETYQVDLKKVLDKLKTEAPDEAAGRRVLIGGPVERERGFVLHTDDWLIEYNELRPHDSLGRVPPLTYMPREMPAGESSFKLST